jgi:uncharacterized protein
MIQTMFTPLASLIGGCMIGGAAVILMATLGRIAGISGIAVRMFPPYLDRHALGRVAFILGLVAAPLIFAKLSGHWATMSVTDNTTVLISAGLLVGAGSVWGNGCTSGHGICGVSRLSVRSLLAVASFMATAMFTVFATRHML